jgi:hypothetical protein
MGGIGRGGGFAGGVTGAHFTEYGPGVPGDQPGQATYDWNSDHHVGAWPGITGPLRAGDVALGLGAQQKYHVMPGQTFTDEYGRTWRFADRSGSKDPMNVDVFKGAAGGIVKRPTMGLIGEAGSEATKRQAKMHNCFAISRPHRQICHNVLCAANFFGRGQGG